MLLSQSSQSNIRDRNTLPQTNTLFPVILEELSDNSSLPLGR